MTNSAPETAAIANDPAPKPALFARGPLRIARLAALSAVARGPGFVIPIVVASLFGAGPYTDGYFLAYGAFLLAGGTVGPALEISVVPFAAAAFAVSEQALEELLRAWKRRALLWAGFSSVLIALGLVVGLAIRPAVGVATSRVLLYYVLLVPAVVAWSVSSVYTGALAARWHLEAGAVGSGFRGLGALGGAAIAAATHSVVPVLIGLSLGESLRVYWLHRAWRSAAAPAPDIGVDPAPALAIVDTTASSVQGKTAFQMLMSQAVNGLSPFAERFILGAFAVAALSHVEYAARLVAAGAVLFDGGVSPWLLARWSTLRAGGKLDHGWSRIYRPLVLASGVALMIGLTIALLAPFIVHGAFRHGKFTGSDEVIVTTLLRWYGVDYFLGMTASCIERLVLARSQSGWFLTLGMARTAVRLGSVISLLPFLGLVALPVGLIISDFCHVVLLLVIVRFGGTAGQSDGVAATA